MNNYSQSANPNATNSELDAKKIVTIKHVNRYTRAGNNGKTIECPKCHNHVHVFHFSWSAITCTICGEDVNKEDWIIPV